MNKDINEWILDEGVEPLHELYNKKGKIIFLTDFLEKHLKEQLTLTDVVKSDSEQLPNMTLEQAIEKAKPNMDKIKDVDKHIDNIR